MPIKRKTHNGKVQWYGRMMVSGTRREKKFQTKREAIQWEQSLRTKAGRVDGNDIPCGSWLEARLDDYKTRNLASYGEKCLSFSRFLNDVLPATPVGRVTPATILAHLSKIAKKISGDRANRQRIHLAEAWGWGSRYMDLPPRNPFVGIEGFSRGKYKEKYVPPERDFWRVYGAATGKVGLMLSLLYFTACRRSEVHEITWEDVDLEGKKIRLGTRKGRNGSWRYAWITLPNELVVDLKKFKLASRYSQATDRVLTGDKGGYLADWSHLIQKLCRKAHVAEFGYHGIRHMVATKLWSEGHTVAQIQQFLRHESPQTTEIYLRSLGVYQTTEAVVATLVVKKGILQEIKEREKKVSKGE